MIQKCFYALLITFFIALIGCFRICLRKKGEYKYTMMRLFSTGMFALLFYFQFLLSPTEGYATLFRGAYYAMTDWILYWLLEYVILYTGRMVALPHIRKVILGAVMVDTAALISNVKTHMMFCVENSYDTKLNISYWTTKFYGPHYLHLVFCYSFVIIIVAFFIYKIMKSPRAYRKMYGGILVWFCVIVVINLYCYLCHVAFDISVLLYIIFAYSICFYTYYAIPKGLKEYTLVHVVEDINSGIFCFDMQGKCRYANKKGIELFEIEHASDYFRIETFHKKWLEEHQKSNHIEHCTWNEQYTIHGEARSFRIEYQRLLDYKNNPMGYFYKVEDKTEEQKEYEMEQFLATHDSLTGLYNREFFFEKAEKMLKEKSDIPMYMVCTNIRNFKLVNDLFGEKLGDQVLKEQANALKLANYDTCIHGRISGDKFAMLIPKDKFNPEYASRNTGRLQNLLSEYNFKLQILIGVYEIKDPLESAKIMYDKANMAISLLQENYAKLFAFYDETIMDKLVHEKEITSEFEESLASHEFCMYLQPQADQKSNIIGAEAVVRWNHPQKGLLLPSDFIEVLERTGLITKLDQFVWRQAAMKLADWKNRGLDQLTISVNISTKDFYFTDLYQYFTNLVKEYEIDPHKLNLEITETVFMSDADRHMDTIYKLQEYGFSIEMDDFGSGYSSLNLLKDIHANKLKIDMVFLQQTDNADRNQIILTSICDMAQSLHMPVIAEGIECEEQLQNMADIGCQVFQGSFFSLPIPVTEFENRFMNRCVKS